jgi:alpha 1,2-mannosyltransferase
MENAVIVYMTRKNDLWVFKHSINFLYSNFNKDANYPVVVLYDDLSKADIANLLTEFSLSFGFLPNIKFEKMEFSLPEGVSEDPALYTLPLTQFRMGYRHMCRFYGGKIFNHPALAKYKWYMRLDSDSFILSKITRDPFKVMRENDYHYAFMEKEEYDAPWACEGLWDATKKFIEENKSRVLNNNFQWNFEVYYTNFEIVDMDFYRSTNYQDYFNYLDSTGNIFYKRWGDHCIRWLGSTMFMPSEKIWCIKEFSYQHGGVVNNTQHIDTNSIDIIPEPYRKSVVAALATNAGG